MGNIRLVGATYIDTCNEICTPGISCERKNTSVWRIQKENYKKIKSLSLSLSLSFSLSLSLSLSVCLSAYLAGLGAGLGWAGASVRPSVCLSVCVSISVSLLLDDLGVFARYMSAHWIPADSGTQQFTLTTPHLPQLHSSDHFARIESTPLQC